MNKFKLIIIISIFISILSISKVYAQILDYTLLGKTIYIDPGHGGIGVSQIWRIAIKPSKYKKFKVLWKSTFYVLK